MPRPARSRVGRGAPIRRNGGFFFAEDPALDATQARILWHADLDPGTLRVRAVPSLAGSPDAIDPAELAPWLTLVSDAAGEHAVLSNGWQHIRLDIEHGSLSHGAVVLEYLLRGLASAEPQILPLRRLIDLARRRRFHAELYPPDRRIGRWLMALQVHDAMQAGASQREMARALFDAGAAPEDFDRRADSLRSRVRRLAREAVALARGGYRTLLRRQVEP